MYNRNLKKELANKNKKIRLYKKEIILLQKQLEYYKNQANIDYLTKLNNRSAIDYNKKYDNVILGDIDYFKKINDEYGHILGDKVLIEVGLVLKKYVSKSDLVCRWGGEEFVILLKNSDDDMAYSKALSIKNEIENLKNKFGFDITMSFGISNTIGRNLDEAICEADKAMYHSKQHGRNMVTIYSLNL